MKVRILISSDYFGAGRIEYDLVRKIPLCKNHQGDYNQQRKEADPDIGKNCDENCIENAQDKIANDNPGG
jgi:hypothetical protein